MDSLQRKAGPRSVCTRTALGAFKHFYNINQEAEIPQRSSSVSVDLRQQLESLVLCAHSSALYSLFTVVLARRSLLTLLPVAIDGSSSSDDSKKRLRAAHGILLCFGWGLLLPG